MKPFAGLGKFDIVFCRNVAIYFTPADKKMVFEKIASVLEPDGSLIIGSTESLTGVTGMFEPKRYMRSIFYQPVAGATPLTPAAFSYAPQPGLAATAASSPPPRAPLPVPRPAPVVAPPVPSRPVAPGPALQSPAAPRPMPPSPAPPSPAARVVPTSVSQPSLVRPAEPEPEMVVAEQSSPREEAARPASFRSAPPRVQPAQVYRAGDKSDLKRLLMLKKQKG
jgi:chemotaxis protein methyltransferase CheR